jgi:plastocyanin
MMTGRKLLTVPGSYLLLTCSVLFVLTVLSCGDSNRDNGGNVVEVTLSDYSMEVDSKGVRPGEVLFMVKNDGNIEHNFVIEGVNTMQRFADNLKPGETRSVRVRLQPSRYNLYCPIDDHKNKGMANVLKVEEPEEDTTPGPGS